MSWIDDIGRNLMPHTMLLRQGIDEGFSTMVKTLKETQQISDLGRPDTGDQFKYFIVRAALVGPGPTPLGQLNPLGAWAQSGPTAGEDWLVQTLAVNGAPNKSPAFQIRTNTGRLLFGVVKEGMGAENPGGDIVILQGEEMVWEGESGNYDFTISVLLRKYPRQRPDAGEGISDAVFDERYRAEHERQRDMVPGGPPAYGPTAGPFTEQVGGDISPDPILSGEPPDTYAST